MLNSVVVSGSSLMNMIVCVDVMCFNVSVVSNGNLIMILSVMMVSDMVLVCDGCCCFSMMSSSRFSVLVMVVWVNVRNSGLSFCIVICVVGSELLKMMMFSRLLSYLLVVFCMVDFEWGNG